MKRQLVIITFFIFAILISSCSHYYYIQNIQNVPLFKEKNELCATMALGGGDEVSTKEVQAAYSITKNIAVMADFMSASGGNVSSNNWGKGMYLDGAVGYYKSLNDIGVFEIYGGIGTSNQHHQYSTGNHNDGTADLSFTKIFLQPSLGLTFKAFDIAISTRFSKLSFNKVDNQINLNNYEIYNLDTIALNRNSFLIEPALTLRGGWKFIKLQLQFSYTNNLTHQNLKFENSNVSLGLYFTIAKRYLNTAPKD